MKDIYYTGEKSSGVVHNNAVIEGKANNLLKEKITEKGFQLSTESDKNKKWTVKSVKRFSEKTNTTGSIKLKYDLKSKVGALAENKTYYARFFTKVGSKYFYSGAISFKTPKKGNYAKISSLGISRIVQGETNSCYLSSVATVYGYLNKGNSYRVGGKDISQSDAVYKEIKKYNGGVHMYDKTLSKYGFKKTNYTLDNIYNSLKAGKPAIIYYNNGNGWGHASVIIGYNGNTNALEEKGFIIMEIKHDQGSFKGKPYSVWENSANYYKTYANNQQTDPFNAKSCYIRYDKWLQYVNSRWGASIKTLCVPK